MVRGKGGCTEKQQKAKGKRLSTPPLLLTLKSNTMKNTAQMYI